MAASIQRDRELPGPLPASWAMTSEHCPYLLTGPPACERSWAENVGVAYDYFQIGFAGMTLIISCITASVLYQLYVRGPLLPLTVHKKVFILIAVLCTSLVVRSFDPFGWRRWFSFTVTQFFIEVGTSAVYSFVFVVIHDWMALVMWIVLGKGGQILTYSRFFAAAHTLTWVSFLTFSLLQSNLNDMWRWRAIKLLCGFGILIMMVLTQSYFGFIIVVQLHRHREEMNSIQLGARRSSVSAAGQPRGSTIIPRRQSQVEMTENKMNKANRVVKLIICGVIIEVLAAFFQLNSALRLMREKYERDVYQGPPPATLGDTLLEGSLDMLQMAAALLLCFFLRIRRPSPSGAGGPDSRENSVSSSRSRGASTGGAGGGGHSRRSSAATLPPVPGVLIVPADPKQVSGVTPDASGRSSPATTPRADERPLRVPSEAELVRSSSERV